MTTGKGWAGLKLPAGSTSIRSLSPWSNHHCWWLNHDELRVGEFESVDFPPFSWSNITIWSIFFMGNPSCVWWLCEDFDGEQVVRIMFCLRILWGTNQCFMVNCTIFLLQNSPSKRTAVARLVLRSAGRSDPGWIKVLAAGRARWWSWPFWMGRSRLANGDVFVSCSFVNKHGETWW